MTENFRNDLTLVIADFLNEIGIPTISAKLEAETFLPGILVRDGRLLVDEEKLAYPGDLLHEAGHLAVAPAASRYQLNDEVIVPGVSAELLEMQAILWSYAACVHLRLDPRLVFHPHGYKGKSESLLFGFSIGAFPGLNKLEENEMAFSERAAASRGVAAFPVMQKWLRD